MANGNLGDLKFTLSIESKIDKQLQKYQKKIADTSEEVEKLQENLKSALSRKDQNSVKAYRSDLQDTKNALEQQNQEYKKIKNRMESVLNLAHKIDETSRKIGTVPKKGVSDDISSRAKTARKEIANHKRAITSLVTPTKKSGLKLVDDISYKRTLGNVRRGISDTGKYANSVVKDYTNGIKSAEREEKKAVDSFEKAEERAVNYYRTRKQHVDDAISSISKRQAELSRLQGKSSAEDVRMLQAASNQLELLRQRLSAAKSEYEQLQTMKGHGMPVALSSTFLGRYTGMSELFGADFSKMYGAHFTELFGKQYSKADNLSYNDAIAKAKEAIELAKQHNQEIEKRNRLESEYQRKTNSLQNKHDNITTEIRGRKQLDAESKRIVRDYESEQKAIDKTIERYNELRSLFSRGLAARRTSNILGVDTTELTEQLTDIANKLMELRSFVNTGTFAPNLYNSGQAKVAIADLKELVNAYEKANDAKINSIDEAITQSLNKEAEAVERVNELLAIRAHRLEMESKHKNGFAEIQAEHRQNLEDAQTATQRSKAEAEQLEHARELARLKEDIIRRSKQEEAYNPNERLRTSFSGFSEAREIIQDQINLVQQQKDNLANLRQQIWDTQSAIQKALGSASSRTELAEQYEKALGSKQNGEIRAQRIQERIDLIDRLNMHLYNLGTASKVPEITLQIGKLDDRLQNLKATMDSLPHTGGTVDLTKTLGLENEPTDWFEKAKRAAQAQEAHLAKEKEITEAFAEEARNVARVNELLEMRKHKAQMEASRPNPLEEYRQNLKDAQSAVAISQAESRRLEHERELARLKEDIISRNNKLVQQEEAQKALLHEQASAANGVASAFSRIHSSASRTSEVMRDIKNIFLQGGIVYAAQSFANSIIQTGGDIVQQHIALRSILGDIQEADTLFAQTQQLALQSPFKFQELNRDVKQLAAFGVDTDRLYDTTKRLADVSSGLGVSFERLGLAYGQVKARSWLDGKELRQFAYAGLPMLQKIADLYNETGKNGRRNYTTSDVRTMITKRQVSFEDVDAVFKRLTDEGGQFYNMQFVLSETLLGKWNKLQDAWSIMLGKFADGGNILGKAFMIAVNGATKLVQELDKLSPVMLSFATVFAGRKLLSAAAGKLGTGTIVADMKKAQLIELNTFVTKQRQRLVEGEITTEKYRQIVAEQKKFMATTASTDQAYKQLVVQGKLNAFQIASLARHRQISGTLISELGTMGMLTQKQALLARYASIHAGSLKGWFASMRVGVSGALSGIFTWSNAIFAAIGIASSVIMAHEQKVSELTSKAADSVQKLSSKAASLKETLRSVNNNISQDSVNAMEGALESAGQLTDEIKQQVSEADTLGEKYEILKERMGQTLLMANQLKNPELTSRALQASGGDAILPIVDAKWYEKAFVGISNFEIEIARFLGFGTDYITDNINKLNVYSNTINNLSQSLSTNFDSIDKAFKQVTDAANDSVFYKQVSNMPFEQRIRAILKSKYADVFLSALKKVDKGAYNTAKDLKKYIDRYQEVTEQVVKKNIPGLIKSIENDLSLLGRDTKTWTDQEVQKFITAFYRIETAAGAMNDYLRSILWKSILSFTGLGKRLNPSGLRVVTYVGKNGKKRDSYIGSTGRDKKGSYIVVGHTKNNRGGYDENKIYDYTADAPKPASPTGGNNTPANKTNKNKTHTDKTLENYKNRVDLYKKFYSDLKDAQKLYGSNAVGYLNETGLYDSVFKMKLSDVSNYTESINQLTQGLSANTAERKKWLAEMKEDAGRQQVKEEQEAFKDYVKSLGRTFDKIKSRYNTYKKISKITGDSDFAQRISSLPSSYGGNFGGYLKSEMGEYLVEKGYNDSPDSVLGLEQRDFNKKYGSDNELSAIYTRYQNWLQEYNNESLNMVEELATKYQTVDQKIEAQNKLYQHQLELLEKIKKNNPNMTDEDVQRIRTGIDKNNSETIAHLNWEKFKDNRDYAKIFSNLERVSTSTIKSILDGLKNVDTKGMSETDMKSLYDAISKATEALNSRAPFSAVVNGYTKSTRLGQLVGSDYFRTHKTFTPNAASAKYYGLQEGRTYKKSDLESEQVSGMEDFNEGLEGIQKTFEALQGALQPVIDLFDALGNKTMSDVFKAGNNALSSAASVAGSFSTLSQSASDVGMNGLSSALGKAGPYGAAAAAAISVGSSLVNKFGFGASANKKWERQNEYLKSMQSTLKGINGNLKEQISSSKSSATSQSASKEYGENLKREASEIRKAYYGWSQAHTIHKNHRNRMYTGLDYEQINAYLREIGYNGYAGSYVGSQQIQNLTGADLEKIREHFPGMWAKLPDDAKEYLNRLIEIEGTTGEIVENDENMVKALSDLDFDTLHDDYKDLLNDLDSYNEDFSDKLEKHLREAILSSMITSLYSQQINDLLDYVKEQATDNEYIDRNGNVKVHTKDKDGNIIDKDIASEYTSEEYAGIEERNEELAERMRETREMFEDMYGWSDGESSSRSSSIKNFSEETADLRASYLNAIRADVSVIRQLTIPDLDSINVTAQAQLQQLGMITQNTKRNADAAESIKSSVVTLVGIFEASQKNQRPLYVNVH